MKVVGASGKQVVGLEAAKGQLQDGRGAQHGGAWGGESLWKVWRAVTGCNHRALVEGQPNVLRMTAFNHFVKKEPCGVAPPPPSVAQISQTSMVCVRVGSVGWCSFCSPPCDRSTKV